MKVTTKVIVWSWVVLLAVVGSMIYGAYSKLNPESLVSLLNTQVQRSYPGSVLAIKHIDYGVSLDFKLKLNDLNLTRSGKTIARAGEVQLKVPWWVILFNRGNASVNVSDLVIYVSSHSAHTNKASLPGSAMKTRSDDKVKVTLPKYLLDAHYTLRAKNISVQEIDGKRRFFTLSKLLLREFQYGKNSAFEVNIPISISHKDKSYSSDLWLFGDVTPEFRQWTLNYRGEFKTKETAEGFRFDDLVVDGKSVFNPQKVDLTSTIDISVERKKVGRGKIVAKYDQIDLDLQFTQFPLDFLNLIGDEIKNPFLLKISGEGEGEVHYKRIFADESSSELSGKLRFQGPFSLTPDQQLEGQWHLNIENEKWKTSFISPKQELKFERRALLDFKESRISQYHQEIHVTSFDLKSALLAVRPLTDSMLPALQTEHTSVVILTNCLEGEKVVNATFRYGITPEQSYYQVKFEGEASNMDLNYVLKKTHQFSVEFKNFNWHSSYTFLLPFFSATEGTLNGKLDGKWTEEWSDGTWLSKLSAENLQNPSGDFLDLNEKVWDHFALDTATIPKRSWQASVEKNSIKLNSLVLEGSDPSQISGLLTTTPKLKSYLTLTHPKNKKIRAVKKDVPEVFWKKETP